MVERGGSFGRVIAAFVALAFLTSLAACDFGPGPTPLPTAVPTPTEKEMLPGVTPSVVARSTRVRPIRPRLLRANALVRTRAADLGALLRAVVDGTYCKPAWRGTVFPASIALPVSAVRGDLLLEWNSSGTSDYISFPDAPTYGLPADYTIATSADSINGRDGTWREVVSVEGNKARTRAHRFPFAGARWVRMTVTGAAPGPLGDMVAIDEIDLHDASDGTEDTVFFLGDSITSMAFTRCPASQPSFAELARRADPQRFPAMIDGGVSGVNSGFGVSVIDDWLELNRDFHIWAIAYGTNDAWQKVAPEVFETHLQTIIDRVAEAGHVPVLARIPFAAGGPADANVRALNQVIDRLAARNGLLPGPDLYAWFRDHPDELTEDGVHLTDAGTRSVNRLWYEALRPLYDTSR